MAEQMAFKRLKLCGQGKDLCGQDEDLFGKEDLLYKYIHIEK
jgi:hypothetical protein